MSWGRNRVKISLNPITPNLTKPNLISRWNKCEGVIRFHLELRYIYPCCSVEVVAVCTKRGWTGVSPWLMISKVFRYIPEYLISEHHHRRPRPLQSCLSSLVPPQCPLPVLPITQELAPGLPCTPPLKSAAGMQSPQMFSSAGRWGPWNPPLTIHLENLECTKSRLKITVTISFSDNTYRSQIQRH